MSDIWIPYGGGADLDPVTATAADVRKGKTIVDKDGNPIGGAMPDIAGRTITPTTSQQTLNGGGYLTGNVVVPGFTPPPANVIKKGYTLNMFGIKIMGTCEGYFPTATDLYYNGVFNISPYTLNTTYWRAENTRLYKITNASGIGSEGVLSNLSINVTAFTKITFEGLFNRKYAASPNSPHISMDVLTDIGGEGMTLKDSSVTQIIVDVTQAKKISGINSFMNTGSYITRIRLS